MTATHEERITTLESGLFRLTTHVDGVESRHAEAIEHLTLGLGDLSQDVRAIRSVQAEHGQRLDRIEQTVERIERDNGDLLRDHGELLRAILAGLGGEAKPASSN